MIESLSQPIAQRVFMVLLHFLWQGALIALASQAVLMLFRCGKAQTRYALSLVGLTMMGLCPLLTFLLFDGHQELAWMRSSEKSVSSSWRPAATHPDVSADSIATSRPASSKATHGVSHEADSLANFILPKRIGVVIAKAQPYLLLAWFVGMWCLGIGLIASYWRTIWIRRELQEIPDDLARRFDGIGRLVGVVVSGRIFCSRRVEEAVAVGFLRPIVLLPLSWTTELPLDVLEAVIAHELAHIRRWDAWVNLLQRLLETVLFYHPAVWWLSNRVRLEREMCCDERALATSGGRLSYAIALECVSQRYVTRQLALAASITGEQRMNMLNRIQYILRGRVEPQAGRTWPVGVLALFLPLAILGMISGLLSDPASLRADGSAEGGGFKSGSAEGGGFKSGPAEGAGQVKIGPRDGEGGPAGPREGDGMPRFRPQTQREAALYQMILQLQREMAQLRAELRSRSARDREEGRTSARSRMDRSRSREGKAAREDDRPSDEQTRLSPRWQYTREGKVFRAYDKNGDLAVTLEEWLAMKEGSLDDERREIETKRFQEAEPSGDGKMTPEEFLEWYTKGRSRKVREGDQPRASDGEGEFRSGPRDGEAADRSGPRDGEGPRGPRDPN